MKRSDALREIADIGRPIEKRLAAIYSVGDLREGEAELKPALDVLLLATSEANHKIREAAQTTLKCITDARRANAHEVFLQGLERELSPEDRNDPSRLIQIFRDSSESWDRRRAACRFLGELGLQLAIGPILEAFSEDDSDLAFEAANALFTVRVRLGRPLTEATSALIRSYRNISRPESREAIIYALGLLGDVESQGLLASVLTDEANPPSLRRRAVEALAIGPPSSIMRDTLVHALSDQDETVRAAAADAIPIIK